MTREELIDEVDGENRALRSFLMQYSCDRSITVAAMAQHMRRSGWESEYWPYFARKVDNAGAHLTKSGAQLWIRHLINLEAAAPVLDAVGVEKPQQGERNAASPSDPLAVLDTCYASHHSLCARVRCNLGKACVVDAEAAKQSLPPLPNPVEEVRAMFRGEFDYARPGNDYYAAEQMREYGTACIVAATIPAAQPAAAPAPTDAGIPISDERADDREAFESALIGKLGDWEEAPKGQQARQAWNNMVDFIYAWQARGQQQAGNKGESNV